jgi:anti-sigma B factor antagonist
VDLTITEAATAAGQRVLTLAGSLDIASRDALLDAAAAVVNSGDGAALVLDLAQVDFIDSSGIGAIVTAAGTAEDGGRGFALRAPSDRVTRVLRIAGLRDAWPITD